MDKEGCGEVMAAFLNWGFVMFLKDYNASTVLHAYSRSSCMHIMNTLEYLVIILSKKIVEGAE